MYLLGLQLQTQSYLCLHSPTGRLYVSRNVLFDETSFPFHHTTSTPPSPAPSTLPSLLPLPFIPPALQTTPLPMSSPLVQVSSIVSSPPLFELLPPYLSLLLLHRDILLGPLIILFFLKFVQIVPLLGLPVLMLLSLSLSLRNHRVSLRLSSFLNGAEPCNLSFRLYLTTRPSPLFLLFLLTIWFFAGGSLRLNVMLMVHWNGGKPALLQKVITNLLVLILLSL